MEENSSAAVEMVEESEVVVEAAEAEKPESSIAVEAPKPKPVRKCSKCGHPSGNSVGKIRYGRIIEVVTEGAKKYEIAAFCDGCAEGEKPVFKIGYLISQIGDMNAQAQAFELARGYWERVVRGIESPEVRKTLEGKLACGVPGCWRCKDNLAAVEHFVVVKIEGKPVIVGICPFQAAALAKCGAEQKLFVTKNFGEARRQVETEVAKAKAFAKAKAQWLAVDAGEAVIEVRVEETGTDDIFRCGVPGCKCREHGDKPVENFVVLDGQPQMPIAGVCKYQFAALKQSGAKIFASSNGDGMGLLRCAKHRRWLLSRAANAVRAVQGRPPRPPRPQDFDRIGGGLARFKSPEKAAEDREKKRATREEVERRRADRRMKLAAQLEADKAELAKKGVRYQFSDDSNRYKGNGGGDKKRDKKR